MHQYRLGADLPEGSCEEKVLGAPVDNRLTTIQHAAPMSQKANGILWCIEKTVQQVKEGDAPPLLCPGEATPGEPHLFLGSPAHRRQGAAEESRVEEHKDDY